MSGIKAEIKLTVSWDVVNKLVLDYIKENFPHIQGYEPKKVTFQTRDVKNPTIYSVDGLDVKVEYVQTFSEQSNQ